MRLHYYGADWPNGARNLGDWLSVPLLRAMGYEPRPPEPPAPVLFAIGSILGPEHYAPHRGSRIVVWGSGILNADDDPSYADLDVRAVRGPLTAARLGLAGAVTLGDPALLVPALLDPLLPPRGPSEVLYISHCGNGLPAGPPPGYTAARSMLVDSDLAAYGLLAAIRDARFVGSESLHGCILAAAFGVPWWPASAGRAGEPLQFKWADWFAYLGADGPVGYPDADAGENMIARWGHNPMDVPSAADLFNAFPYELADARPKTTAEPRMVMK